MLLAAFVTIQIIKAILTSDAKLCSGIDCAFCLEKEQNSSQASQNQAAFNFQKCCACIPSADVKAPCVFKTCLPSGLTLMSPPCHMQAIERQAAAGVAEADALVLVMDGQQGLTGADEEVVSWLRKTHPKKPLLLAVNKCENPQKADLQVRPLS